MIPSFLALLSYLVGAIPSSYIAGRLLRGIDLRVHGSGNLGATNTLRVLGPRVAAPVLVFDIVKGFVPTALFPAWAGQPGVAWALAFGASAIIGHVFSVYVGFRGGKGVATATGVFLALSPAAVLAALVVWIATIAIWRMASLASITAAVALVGALGFTESRPAVLALGLAVSLFVVIAHRANIGRILRGDEPRFGSARALGEKSR